MTHTIDRRLKHELDNHIGIVVGYAELVLSDPDDDAAHRSELETIAREALELVRMLREPPSARERPDEARERFARGLAAIQQACRAVLLRVPKESALAADVREMLRAADAAAAIAPEVIDSTTAAASSPRPRLP